MNRSEYCHRLDKIEYTAGMNACYHQKMEARYDGRDKLVRIAVAIGAVIGTIFAVPKFDESFPTWIAPCIVWTGFAVAILSLVAAAVLNIVPIVEKAKFHAEMFHAWSELRKDALLEEHKTCEIDPEEFHIDRLADFINKAESLNAAEPPPDEKLLASCQDDENRKSGRGKYTRNQEATITPA